MSETNIILKHIDQRFSDAEKLNHTRFKGIDQRFDDSAIIQAEMLRHQKITNSRVNALEEESLTRGLTCKAAVEEMQNVTKDKKTEKKEEKIQKLSKRQWVALFIVSAIVGGTSVAGFIISIVN